MGLVDFTMSIAADNVLVNLVANTVVGRFIFPEIYGNRAIDYVYNPGSFSRLLDDAIADADSRPMFLYVHLCAGHWPYRTSSLYQSDDHARLLKGEYASGNPSYLRALSDADVQLGHLLETLKAEGILENSVVLTLSDHGEDFDMKKDAILNEQGEPAAGSVYGHGGSAFRAPQTQVLLAVKRYGAESNVKANIDTPASLIDVAPTLLELSGLPLTNNNFDGMSLAGYVTGSETENHASRLRFIESSFFFASLNKKNIDAGEVADEASKMYEFTPSGRVQVKEEFIDDQIDYRQRAVQQGQWIVATHADKDSSAIVIDRFQRRWWPLDQAPEDAPTTILLEALCAHWKKDRVLTGTCAGALMHGQQPN